MRKLFAVTAVAALAAAAGCSQNSATPNTGPPIQMNPKGPGPMTPPGAGGTSGSPIPTQPKR